ncbi:hypothetical protein [Streptomyces rugosispiralis]|uniref:Uncharacterized protein n=1 Tax=Streptomyces rugosispiralis TaxID=2967341 RepID=A0ABT1V092_9ACTN|nr:hypothetical protein [Streptomyces rugosispiralis]MCQ8190438.1 hypothetical protein [Streptomyces rugosispiralis]
MADGAGGVAGERASRGQFIREQRQRDERGTAQGCSEFLQESGTAVREEQVPQVFAGQVRFRDPGERREVPGGGEIADERGVRAGCARGRSRGKARTWGGGLGEFVPQEAGERGESGRVEGSGRGPAG